ncbi:malto-oligosyltrehalose trehalohydrolase [Nakamurella antarctica]|uniref:Malto-oligosyltrehalose trehalohydrolase n=1 Tax=Nakamurella antarctica TaxID=1902245 RepID=A0A3G8ZQ61_9ACTN|nr:malto-oligosyltrehalose trehalohydrolase [Nakamurella antarctica]
MNLTEKGTQWPTPAGALRVWAPKVDRVRVVVGGGDSSGIEMTADGDGWFSAPALQPNTDYGFLLGGGTQPLPDPRSRRQPYGVHGLSRTYDADSFPWTDESWTGRQLAGGVIYELHIGTFTVQGTFDAAIEKLDHVASLGVSFVEILPVNAFNGVRNWGYDGVDWYAVQETYGGPAGYQRLVDACHQRGLAVVQDVVYNHLGPSGNYLPEFGPYLHSGSSNTWGDSLNLDGPDSEPVRRHIIDNALMWFRDYHVDALRLDAVHALVDHSAIGLLEQMAMEVAALSVHLGRPLTLIAESDMNDSRLITPRVAGGTGIDAQWSDDFHHVVHVALTGEKTGYYGDFGSMKSIAKVLTRGFFHDGTWSSFRGRPHGRPVRTDTTETWRFVVFAQDHDQIGNRATGDRLSATLDAGSLAMSAVLLMTSPFTPMLFMGEEWGAKTPWQFFTSHPEQDLGEATARGRIAEFAKMGWDESKVPNPQDESTFLNSKLNWSEPERPEHAELLDTYRRLAVLRRDRPELTDPRFGATTVSYDDDACWLIVERGPVNGRTLNGRTVTIAYNFAHMPVTLEIGSGEVLLATGEPERVTGGWTLAARSAMIVAR